MLWNDKIRQEFAEREKIPESLLRDRRSGRSTALALDTISMCYRMRGTWIPVIDHLGTTRANRYLLETIRQMVGKLGFDGFEYKALTNEVRLAP